MTTIAGTNVFVRLEFDTKDAMGMNMVTIASAKVSDQIAEATGARLIALSGNLCTDKKPAAVNTIRGRGRSVVAGVYLAPELIRDVLKTDAATLIEVNTRKNLVGSARAGALGSMHMLQMSSPPCSSHAARTLHTLSKGVRR